jgi:hypothetical protein
LPDQQAQGPEFNLQYCQKNPKKQKATDSGNGTAAQLESSHIYPETDALLPEHST